MANASTSSPLLARPYAPRRQRKNVSLILSILLLNDYASGQVSKENTPTSSLDSSTPLLPRQLHSRPSIPMTPGLPSTSSLPRQLSSTFDSILSSLSSSIESLTSRTFRASRLSSSIEGLPGTAITETSDFEAVQEYLDCMNGRGEWIYDPSGSELAKEGKGLTVHKMDSKYANCDKRFYKERSHNQEEEEEGEWNIRESLKYRFKPSSTCSLLLPVHLRPERSQDSLIPSRTRFCQLLAHKSVLLLGSTSQYSLHDLILDFTTTEPTSCYGDLYCKEHALCGGILGEKDAEEVESIENWEVDQRVYHRLPLPPAHSSSSQHPYPSTQSSKKGIYPSPTYSTLLRYRRTDGLKPFTYQTLPNYQHPFSGLLEKNQQWLADSRRSDLVILEKPPIALPLKNHNATFDEWFYRYLEDKGVEMEDKVERLLEAVGEVTERVWVPELLEALRSIRSEPSPLDQLVVYRSGWRIQPDCASSSRSDSSWDSPGDGNLPPHSSQPSLSELIYRSSSQTLQPLHVIYHNLQLVFQSHLSRTLILPRFGIISLDLETPLSIWRTGLLGSSTAGKEQRGLKSAVGGDCERYCFPSPGMAIEGAFIGGLERLMEVAWAGVRGKEKEWVGEEFRNLRMRMKDREERA